MSINIKPSHKGKLHKALGIAKDKPIPTARLEKAIHSTNANLRKEAQFALNAKKFKH